MEMLEIIYTFINRRLEYKLWGSYTLKRYSVILVFFLVNFEMFIVRGWLGF